MVTLKSMESLLVLLLIVGLFFAVTNLYMSDKYDTQAVIRNSIYQLFATNNLSTGIIELTLN